MRILVLLLSTIIALQSCTSFKTEEIIKDPSHFDFAEVDPDKVMIMIYNGEETMKITKFYDTSIDSDTIYSSVLNIVTFDEDSALVRQNDLKVEKKDSLKLLIYTNNYKKSNDSTIVILKKDINNLKEIKIKEEEFTPIKYIFTILLIGLFSFMLLGAIVGYLMFH